jgi:transmembrane sensor
VNGNDIARRLDEARGHMQVQWSDERAASAEKGMHRKRRRRTAVRVGASAVVAVALVLGAVTLFKPSSAVAPAPVIAVAPAPVPAEVETTRVDAKRTRYTVRKHHVVRAGVVEVQATNARFMMEQTDSVHLYVEEGELTVRWPGGEEVLTAGDEGWYPPPVVEEPEPAPATPNKRPRAKHAAWKRLAEAGDFTAAYDELRKTKATVRDEPAELLLSADVSRLSHHPAEAVAPLQQVLARHASDPRAPLAAFTLGRVLLEELGRPGEAGDAFARARVLAPKGPLADDALAREVEARSRAGDMGKARTLAEEYLRKLPDGPRARLVRHHGGLE